MPSSKIKEAVSNGDLPKVLYKYRMLNANTEDMIMNGNIYFSLSKDFNDPYEFNVKDSGKYVQQDIINYLISNGQSLSQAQSIANSTSNIQLYATNLLEQAKQNKSNTIGVLCLSETPNNTLMWSHYADEHKGCVVGIDVTQLPSDSYFPFKVNYQTQYPQMEYLKCTSNFLKMWGLTKSSHWQYEEERRILLNNKHGVDSIPSNAIVEVIFGCKADKQSVTSLMNKISTQNPAVTIKHATLSHTKYEVIV